MPVKNAKRQYLILKKLHAEGGIEYDYPVGYGEYLNYTHKSKKFGFLITGVEVPYQERVWDTLVREDRMMAKGERTVLELIREDKNVRLAAVLFWKNEDLLRAYGAALRNFHDRGYYHGYPHLENIYWNKEAGRVVFHDFESSKLIRYLSAESRVGYRLIDLRSAYLHFLYFVFGEVEGIEADPFVYETVICGNPFRAFFEGYFYREIADKKIDVSSAPAQVADISRIGRLCSIQGIDYKIISLLRKIENGNKSGPGLIERSFMGNDLMSEALVQQAI